LGTPKTPLFQWLNSYFSFMEPMNNGRQTLNKVSTNLLPRSITKPVLFSFNHTRLISAGYNMTHLQTVRTRGVRVMTRIVFKYIRSKRILWRQ
jgi:hypothetical protein